LGGWSAYYVRDTEVEIDSLMGQLGGRHEQEAEESSQAN
jgi:hypothetical protein